jgi:hypothetical protein
LPMKRLLIVVAALWATAAFGQTAVPTSYFGMHLSNVTGVTWPKVYFGTSRTVDAVDGAGGVNAVFWKDIETARGVYSWTHLDNIMATYQAHNLSVIYTFMNVPGWANGNAGDAVPPTSLQDFYDFVTALATRYKGKIAAYEMWNEPSEVGFWAGSVATLATMTQNAYPIIKAIDPSALVLSPSIIGASGLAWVTSFLALGTGPYFDVLSIHCYPWSPPPQPPEFTVNMIAYVNYMMTVAGISKPIWDTEFSNTYVVGPTAPVDPIFLSVNYIIGWPNGISRKLWYLYDSGITSPIGNLQGSNQGLNVAGAAYRVVYSWLIGATWTSAPARQLGSNGVRNPTMSGAAAGTPGTPPTNMSVQANDSGHGISTQIVGTGTVNGVNYIDWRVYGTATAAATGWTRLYFESSTQIVASLGQYWTQQVNVALSGGALTNSVVSLAWLENTVAGAYIQDGYEPIIPSSLSVDQQAYWTYSTPLTGVTVARVQPNITVSYSVGQAIDLTLRIALPSMDNGTVWQGDLTRVNGAASRIVWDASGGPTTYNVPSQYNYYRDIAGSLYSIPGSKNITITNSPVILDTSAQAVRMN